MRWAYLQGMGLFAASLAACGGPIEELPVSAPEVAFQAQIGVQPPVARPGRRVTFTIEMTHTGRTPALVEVVLQVVDPEGALVYEQTWDEVAFSPGENWNMTQSFLTDTDLDRAPHAVGLRIWSPQSGEVFFE
ncbi:MAG: hypothetical protein ACOZIN_05350, partial [Myxococcota bacterium]